jgi:ketosteroid isomerase-like protein
MSVNTEIVTLLVDSYNRMDTDKMQSILHPEATHSDPLTEEGSNLVGRDAIVQYMGGKIFPKFTSVEFDLLHVFEDRESPVVVAEWRNRLKTKTGVEYENKGVFVVEIKDDKVFTVREYYDTYKAQQMVGSG